MVNVVTRLKLSALIATIVILQSAASNAEFKPGIIDASSIHHYYASKTHRYFTNTAVFENPEQGRWISSATSIFSIVSHELGTSRENDDLIREQHKKLTQLIPNLPPLEDNRAVRSRVTNGFFGPVDFEEKLFFQKSRPVKNWLCIIKSPGLCEILLLEANSKKIVRTKIIHHRKSFFSRLPYNASKHSPNVVFENYYPGDILSISGSILGIEFAEQNRSFWLTPDFIIFDTIDTIKLHQAGSSVAVNKHSDFTLADTPLTVETIFKHYDILISSTANNLVRKGVNEDGASLIVNSTNFMNPDQREILNGYVEKISIILQPEKQSRALDEARNMTYKGLLQKIPDLIGLDETIDRSGTGKLNLQKQILDISHGLPLLRNDDTVHDWKCIVTAQKPKGQCSVFFFAKNGNKLFETKIALWQRSDAKSQDPNRKRPNYQVLPDFYPGDVVSFSGSMFGLDFDDLSKYETTYYPTELYFSTIEDPKLVKLPFKIMSLGEHSLQTQR